MKHQPTGENENLNYGTEHAEIIYNQSPDKRDENLLSQQQEKEKNKKQISKLKSKLEREETAEIASNTTQKVYDELQKLYTKGKLSNEEIISNTRKMINHLHQGETIDRELLNKLTSNGEFLPYYYDILKIIIEDQNISNEYLQLIVENMVSIIEGKHVHRFNIGNFYFTKRKGGASTFMGKIILKKGSKEEKAWQLIELVQQHPNCKENE